MINGDILTDSQASNVSSEITSLRSELESYRIICFLLQRFQQSLQMCEDLFFNHELILKDYVEENKKMRDVDRQFNKMKSECIKDVDCRLCTVVHKMHSVEKRNKSDIITIEENTPVLEEICKILQDYLHKLRLEKINKKILTFQMKD